MRWPLHPLLHLRDHRVTAAERALLQALREVQQARLAETAAADAVACDAPAVSFAPSIDVNSL